MRSNNPMGEVPRLETKRLVLRKLRLADAEAIFAIYGDAEVMRYRDVLSFTHLEEAQHFLEQMLALCEQGEEMHWGITLKKGPPQHSIAGSATSRYASQCTGEVGRCCLDHRCDRTRLFLCLTHRRRDP